MISFSYLKELKTELKKVLEYQKKKSTRETVARLVNAVAVSMFAISSVMTLMNVIQAKYFMALTTFLIMCSSALCIVISVFSRIYRASIALCILTITSIFTYYFISGQNEGFASLWIILLPMAVLFLCNIRVGLISSAYFFALISAFCYIPPLRSMISENYTETFLDRFPILYLCSVLISFVLVFQNAIYHRKEDLYKSELEEAVLAERKKNAEISMQAIIAISNSMYAKDEYTRNHSQRVADYSCIIAKKLGWNEDDLKELNTIALLHDIGKIGIPDNILNKTSKLTEEEFKVMQTHTVIGGDILKILTFIPKIELGAKFHHERWDGTGYPLRLYQEEIPIEARIIGVADAFDAMCSSRVYREKQDLSYIEQELKQGRGTQFDPEILDVFLSVLPEIMESIEKSK